MKKDDIQLHALHTIIRLNELLGHFAINLKDIFPVATVEVERLFSADYCDILLLSEDGRELKSATQTPTLPSPPQEPDKGIVCRAIKEKKLIICNEKDSCPYMQSLQEPLSFTICMPISYRKAIAGVLCTGYKEDRAVSSDELNIMIAITNLISLSIERNILYEDLRKEKERLESAYGEIKSLYDELGRKMTELKETQEQLLQSQKMEAMGRLAGGIAHDFNNILVSIQGYAELAASLLPDEAIAKRHLEKVLKSCERASSLTSQILAMSRKQVIDFQVVDLTSLIKNFEVIFKTLISEDIKIKSELSPYLPPVEGDLHQIEQVIMNIVINARDAMEDGGELTLKTEVVEVGDEKARLLDFKQGRYATLTITDTGQGMTQEVLRHIFEPFYTTKKEDKGTGLGLAVAYGIIKQHKGAIEVESQPGKGASFRIYLPVTEKSAPHTEKVEKVKDTGGGSEHILIVEDDEGVRSLLKEVLTSLGYGVTEAEDGEEALSFSDKGEGFYLIITDVIMPGMDGRKLYEAIKERLPRTKVIFISGYADDIIHKHGVKEKDIPFLEKPFTLKKIATKVREVLDGN